MPRPSRWIVPKVAGSQLVRRMADAGLTAAARVRTRRLDRMDAAAVQEKQLLKLVRKAAETRFGREHGFEHIHSVSDFQARVPLRDYEDFFRVVGDSADLPAPLSDGRPIARAGQQRGAQGG